jgi:hypothetical protein
MTVRLQMGGRVVVVVMVGACNEAEAPSCRVIARGSCVFPAVGEEIREAGGGNSTRRIRQDSATVKAERMVKVMEMIRRGSETVPEQHPRRCRLVAAWRTKWPMDRRTAAVTRVTRINTLVCCLSYPVTLQHTTVAALA